VSSQLYCGTPLLLPVYIPCGSTRNMFARAVRSRPHLSPSALRNSPASYFPLLGLGVGLTVGLSLGGGNASIAELEGEATSGIEQKPVENPSFREEVIGSYEDRIRNFSSPERVFEFFASVTNDRGTFMTAEDFARAIMPYQHCAGTQVGSSNVKFNYQARYRKPTTEQREEYKATLQKILEDSRMTSQEFASMAEAKHRLNITSNEHLEILSELGITTKELDGLIQANRGIPREGFIAMVDVDGDGLISYDEFMLFHTLLAVPPKQLGVAFCMFDRNGSGTIDLTEFCTLMAVMRGSTNAGRSETPRHHKPQTSKLKHLFFGEDGTGVLDLHTFSSFVCTLQREALIMQFNLWDHDGDGKLSAREFAKFLATKVNMNRKLYKEYLKRAESSTVAEIKASVTLEDFLSFHHMLQLLPEMEVQAIVL
ncbi:unnamed protein product, partial [Discosporangium mesarthrocarpum]